MRRVSLDDPAAEGATLARDISTPTGESLARAGLRLTPRSLQALAEHGITVCFVGDAASAGVADGSIHAHPATLAVRSALAECCRVLVRGLDPLRRHPTSRAIDELRQSRPLATAELMLEAVRATVPAFVAQVQAVDAADGLLPDRHPLDDLVGHSVHVATIAGRLGVAVGFAEPDVAATVYAALLHDLGLLLVPDEVRRTPEVRRSPAERRRYEDHALLGEALLAPTVLRSPAVPLVAVEHHEEQAGHGYPRGLAGGNRILRTAIPGEQPRIALVSEIVAVADRYDRLVAPAPGARPLSALAARRVIAVEAGQRLNAEVTARLLELLPAWPLGAEVRLRGGEMDGWRAVVVAHRGGAFDRPVLRLIADAAGHPVGLIEVDLRQLAGVTLEPVDGASPAAAARA